MFLYKITQLHIYVNLGLLKFHDIDKMYTYLLLYDYLCNDKPCNFLISLVSEQGNYSPCTASSQHFFLFLDSRTKINLRKFCPSVIDKYYWNDLPFLFVHYQLKSSSKKQFYSVILFKIDFLVCCCCAF